MSNSIIQVTNLSKSYTISHEGQERYTSLRDVIARKTKKIFSFPKSLTTSSPSREEFWALKDINFNIEQGDRVGIIGRNGAGKSTLLKILSRITEPTTGQIKIKGRVASLLEVGTGFHPELTGRENVYLNGAILGMSRAEIKKHFDAIVDFSGVEKFLDTPVKRYSSGMYVRLAFAVAAHLEPEILIVDEVLAVGDAEFQKKCLGKMEDISVNEGRTILFVSHNLGAIKNICSRGFYLVNGAVRNSNEINLVIEDYLKQTAIYSNKELLALTNKRSGNQRIMFASFHVENSYNKITQIVMTGEDIYFVFRLKVIDIDSSSIDIGFSIHDTMDELLTVLYSSYKATYFSASKHENNIVEVRCKIKNFFFSPGRLFIKGRIEVEGLEADWPKINLGFIDVEMGDFYSTGHLGYKAGNTKILLNAEWI